MACSCAEDDGSAVVGDGDGGSGVGVGGGSGGVRVALGSLFVGFAGTGDTVLPLPSPPFGASSAVGPGPRLPAPPWAADAEADAEDAADPPGPDEPPLAVTPPAPLPPPPLAVDPPSGAAPPCRRAECAGVGPPAPSPTLMQPVTAATAITVAARRTGT